ncbi:MAG: metal-sulfur cluster assembly factor [Candidatus Aenigmarchaeota archaeon]|nr:metal-sulfur cluster assembly factor [Candidatus Aenigmarchaeota archaeon]
MPTKEDIMEALKEVNDPELRLSIVELGLVYDVKIENETVHVTMTLTSIACPLGPMIAAEVEEKIKSLGFKDVRVEITFNPPWSHERMSGEVKMRLGLI